MLTVTVQIGNSDDKLTQREWHRFALAVGAAVRGYADEVHFNGASSAVAEWQNAAFVFEIGEKTVQMLRDRLVVLRAEFRQESIAWTEGETSFI